MWKNKYCFRVILLLLVFLLFQPTEAENAWTGKWFPYKPYSLHDIHNFPMGIKDSKCDNTDNIAVDFDPSSEVDKLMYTCLENPTKYNPSYNIRPLLMEYIVPLKYTPLHKCLNVSILYDVRLPTYGAHRPNWPQYGEYKYLPIQRWLHSVEHGAVVMLYHPCANYKQVQILKEITKKCLYRHIITPFKNLLPERPLALVVWGKSLEMSVVHNKTVINFIKMNALNGPEKIPENGQYNKLILENAKTVTDFDDSEICPTYS